MNHKRYSGFTIVELLVVIVVIAILTAIITVSYNGISRNTQTATVKTDLQTISNKLKLYRVDHSEYPETLITEVGGSTPNTTIQYTRISPTLFCLSGTSTRSTDIVFHINQQETLASGLCEGDEEEPSEPPVTSTNEACFAINTSTQSITDYYSHENNNVSAASCPQAVVIPETINGQPIVSIAGYAFTNKSLTSVVIPSSIETIGAYAFTTNNLTNLTIHPGLKSIGNYAFRYNSLSTLTLPNTVTSIGASAFRNNVLTSVTIPSSVVSIGSYGFGGNQLSAVSLSNNTVISGSSFDGSVVITRY